MKFLLDHDVPDRIAEVLLAIGHECVRLREILPKETPDAEVLTWPIATTGSSSLATGTIFSPSPKPSRTPELSY